MKGGTTVGDKKKQLQKKAKKKLEISKETVTELSDQQLDQVAGGACGASRATGLPRDVALLTARCGTQVEDRTDG
jgi:hypothetical protein